VVDRHCAVCGGVQHARIHIFISHFRILCTSVRLTIGMCVTDGRSILVGWYSRRSLVGPCHCAFGGSRPAP
jgi:hypothetical protein